MKNFLFLSIPSIINTSDNDLVKDFFVPILQNAQKYDRGVGYFSSGWLKINSSGLVQFAENGGKARWVTSPILSKDDWEALRLGDDAKWDGILRDALSKNITNLEKSLEKDTLSALAWLVADDILEFKLAVLKGKLDGEFHDKFGIFHDCEGNQISFSGSYNESIQGTKNYESFKIFKSWIPEQINWVKSDSERFERLWDNNDPNVLVLDISESNKQQIIKFRTEPRPYTFRPSIENTQPKDGTVVTLRGYQEKAILNWFQNDCTGFYEMATGTGKTITALASAEKLYAKQGRLGLIITVPYQHLVEQWENEAKKFDISAILAYKSRSIWINQLNSTIIEFNNKYRDFFCVITTHTTFALDSFQQTIARLNAPSLIIADEAHHLGTEAAQKSYPNNVPFRLALSATPDRWFDDLGSDALRKFFGKTVYEFPLKDAIGISLTPYYYYPHLVELTDNEMIQYEKYSIRIAKLSCSNRPQDQERLKYLLIKRADLLNKAANKLIVLSELIDKNPIQPYTLFYCAPGQIDDAISMLGTEKGILVHPFTAHEDTILRQKLLESFAKGELQSLAAIRCLDEGVDVPNTRTAYLLASTSNPREFIQRRGRILRKAPGKEFSILHDLITVPPFSDVIMENNSIFDAERSIMKRELARFKEFADYALNKHQAIDCIWKIADRYHLTDF